jgi:hypothetical protein
VQELRDLRLCQLCDKSSSSILGKRLEKMGTSLWNFRLPIPVNVLDGNYPVPTSL